MKHIFTTAVFAVSAAVFAADITDDFSEKIWGHWNSSACKVTYKQGQNGIKDTPCAEIVFRPEHNTTKDACFLKDFPVESGKQYEASVMIKNVNADKAATAHLLVQTLNDKKKFVASHGEAKRKISGEWQKISCTFTVPADIQNIRIIMSAAGQAEADVLFDDFALKQTTGVMDHFDSDGSVTLWKDNKAKTQKIYVEDDGKAAKGCVGVEILEGNPKNNGGSLLRRVPVEKGKEYTFIVQVKAIGLTNDTKIGLNIQGQDSKTQFLGTGVQGTSIKAETCRDWKQMVFTYKIPTTGKWANCAYVLVTMSTSGDVPGKALFDDFECFANDEEE